MCQLKYCKLQRACYLSTINRAWTFPEEGVRFSVNNAIIPNCKIDMFNAINYYETNNTIGPIQSQVKPSAINLTNQNEQNGLIQIVE